MKKDELAGKADELKDRANRRAEAPAGTIQREEVEDGEDIDIDIDIDPEIEEADDE